MAAPPPEIAVPIHLLNEESARWMDYGEAVHGGKPSVQRRALFAAAMQATERCLKFVRVQRQAQAPKAQAA